MNCTGAVNYSERILLILSSERIQQEQQEEDFDLANFYFELLFLNPPVYYSQHIQVR